MLEVHGSSQAGRAEARGGEMGPGCGTGHPKKGVLGAVLGCRTTLQAALGRMQPLERPAQDMGQHQPLCWGSSLWWFAWAKLLGEQRAGGTHRVS